MTSPAADGSPPMTESERAAWALGREEVLVDVLMALEVRRAMGLGAHRVPGYEAAVQVVRAVAAGTSGVRA